MKILMLNNANAPIGGAETVIVQLRRALAQRGHQVRLLAGEEVEGLGMADATFRSFTPRSPRRLGYVYNHSACRALKRELRDFRPDLVHLHNVSKASPFILMPLRDIPTVLTVHDHTSFDPTRLTDLPQLEGHRESFSDYFLDRAGGRFYLEKLRFAVLRQLAPNVDLTLSASEFYRRCLLSSAIFPRISTLHNGIALGESSPLPEGKMVLFVGRLTADKGAHVLLEAAGRLRSVQPQATFLLAGEGEQAGQLKRIIASLGLGDRVKMLGHQSGEQLTSLYRQAAVVVVPSLHPDNLPTVCIEAMAAGRPVVASDIGGLPELVEEGRTGMLIRAGDSRQLASALQLLLSDRQLRQKMGEAGRKKAEEEFSLEIYVERTLRIYINLIHAYENPDH